MEQLCTMVVVSQQILIENVILKIAAVLQEIMSIFELVIQ